MASLLASYLKNEENNDHTENAWLLAQAFGDGAEQDEGRLHAQFLTRNGYQSHTGTEFQARMSRKYYHLLKGN
jgi:hypothetical protein